MRIQAFLVTFVNLQVPQESNLKRGHVRTMQACNGWTDGPTTEKDGLDSGLLIAWSRLGKFTNFVLWPSVTDRKALGLRSVRRVPGRVQQRSVTDRDNLSLRSAKVAYGPQEFMLTVRKPVAGSRIWTAACSACYTDLERWFSKQWPC